MKHPEIRLTGLQIKSDGKAKLLAKHLTQIEIECGIRSTLVTLDDCFICPDLDAEKLNGTPMESVLKKCIEQVRKKKAKH
jgi:hypothetical protein